MNALLLLATLSFAPQGTSTAPVVINEFSYDDSSTDNREFVELYNRSIAPVDISGWMLLAADPTTTNPAYTIPPLTILAPGGRWTLGANAANPGLINQVVGTADLWENDNESLTLVDTNGRTIDTLVYEAVTGIWNATLAEGPGVRARFITQDTRYLSFQRCPDGNDNNNNGYDFQILPATPGTANYPTSLLPYTNNFDAPAAGTTVPEFLGSFVDATVIDPTVVGPLLGANNLNPNVIPASPQGGRCAIFWDPSGGGAANYLQNACVRDVRITAEIYLPAPLAPATNGETWTISVRGIVDYQAQHPDPSGMFYTQVGATFTPGHTGVAAVWQRSPMYNKLFLVDFTDGSATAVLGAIDIVAGTNDGWRNFELYVAGNRAFLCWGNQSISGTVTTMNAGSICIGYREQFTTNANTRPLTLDDLRIEAATTAWTEVGDAGDLPTNNQVPCGIGPLNSITTFFGTNDADMYRIRIDDPATFGASTVGGATVDTQLFLFTEQGIGITFNDDDPAGAGTITQSRITGAFVPGPGLYLLAVSRYDRDPTGNGQEIWADTPFVTERAPDGPAAALPVNGWNSTTSSSAAPCVITLTGASFACDADVVSYGTGAGSSFGVPSLSSTSPRLGAAVTFTLNNPDPSATAGALGVALLRGNFPFFHGQILIDAIVIGVSIPVPMGSSSIGPVNLPCDRALCGQRVRFQAVLAVNPTMTFPHGVTMTNGLEWLIGL
jgi:hypothetical protein